MIESHLHCSVNKEHVLIGGQTLHVCLLEYTVTNNGSTHILAVNKFYACMNLVKIIFKHFVSVILYFRSSTFKIARFTNLIMKNQFFKKPRLPDFWRHIFTAL